MGLSWDRLQVEAFFRSKFEFKKAFEDSDESLHEMRFEAGKLRYWLVILERPCRVALHADPDVPDSPLPAIEIQFHCTRISEVEASGGWSVLQFYMKEASGKERVCLHVARTKNHLYSIAPDFGSRHT